MLDSKVLGRHKRAVKVAEKTGDADKVLAATDAAFAYFESAGYPDDWSYIQRAADDARFGSRMY